MNKLLKVSALALAASALLGGTAWAQLAATAVTDLNIRVGPGPQYQAVDVIAAGDSVTVLGCLEGSQWCQIDKNGSIGWSYSAYLTATVGANAVVVAEQREAIGVPVVTFDASDTVQATAGATVGGTTGAVIGTLLGGPVGGVIGATVGASAGAAATIDVPDTAVTFVRSNPVDNVLLEGEVVVGAVVPEVVELHPIPDVNLQYVWINGQPVLVDVGSRQIVRILR
jgi:uncharacterized protein YraI